MKKILLIALIAICSSQLITAQNSAKIDIELQQEMSLRKTGDLIRINIIMNQQYDQMEMRMKSSLFPTKAAKRAFVIGELKRFSNETQQGVITLLSDLSAMSAVSEIQSLWIVNFINCYATIEAIEELSLQPDILIIGFDKMYNLIPDQGTSTLVEPTREIVANVLKVQADKVWTLGYEGEDVIVAVLDTGVNYDHNDLKSHMWEHHDYPYYGWDFVNNDNNPKDDDGHGTHCSGTVAGNGASGSQTGVAPKATIMAVKILDSDGSGTLTYALNGIQFAVDKGADVLSMSFGWSGGGDAGVRIPMRNAMKNTLEAGVIAAVSAGNEGGDPNYPIPNNVGCPGNCPPPWLHPDQTTTGGTTAVVCVGATNNSDGSSYFSSRGPVTWQSTSGFNDYPYNPGMGLIRPDVCAPGENIKSLSHYNNSNYVQYGWSGTSMSAPCVAGTMALMLSKNPTLEPAEICEILETTAVHLPNSSSPKGNTFGSGRIDALAAINATQLYIEDIIFEGLTISDNEGNNNGRLNPGETVGLTVSMKNFTNQPINNVTVTFETADGLITIINGEADFGNFAAEEVKTVENAFTIALSEDAVSGNQINCTVEAAFEGFTRKTKIQLTVHDFILSVLHVRIPDKTEIMPGETSDMRIYIDNTGNEIASNLIGKITTTSPYLIINESTAHYGELYPDKYKHKAYSITISPETPSTTTYVPFTITVTEKSGRKMEKNEMLRLKNIGQPPLPCDSVEDLSVEITSSTAILTWTAPEGSVPEKYLVYCNDVFLGETTATTYTQADVIGGNYHHCIEALYSDGCTSEIACVESSLPCDITVDLTLEGSPNSGINLSWLPVIEGMKYNVYRNSELIATVTGNSYTDSGLELNPVYCYTVTAVCTGDVESNPSNEECIGTGINEMQNQIRIYPNPTGGELIIENGELKIENIEIFDALGRMTLEQQSAEGRMQHEIDMSNLSTGVYFVRIQTENGTVIRKIVKQ